ncbi:adiponectin receptor [Strigomonas culicis]|nr:adiponectin receptor [Strigomonas culicis]|eukprot:EPY29478.1 adiponectin receptor [Strigomonas culicis]
MGVPPLFDPAREQQFNLLYFKRCPGLPLYPYHEICPWQKYNPYIRTGYRAYYTTKMTLKSLVGWHNETLNVWTHFSGFFFFLAFSIVVFATLLTKTITSSHFSHVRFMYFLFCGGSVLCMLNSAIYHLFTGHCRHRLVVAMGRLDFLGITALIVASFLPPLYTIFSCLQTARNVYIALILILGFAGLVGPWTAIFHEHTLLRTGIYVGMVACGTAPSVHFMLFFPHTKYSAQMAYGVILMIILYGVGVVFYISGFPESRYPGHFDYLLSSHQLWHYFVLMAALVHYFNCLGMYQAWLLSDGAC